MTHVRPGPFVGLALVGWPMPTISEFFGMRITMYFDDHGDPHFHARYAE
jgi:hypothetical protein